MNDLVLRGGTVLGPEGPVEADVRVSGGVVVDVGPGLDSTGAEVLDCSGTWVGPGLVDLHVHFREPGEEWKEDIESGSWAGAAGGFTALLAMPNTEPPIDSGHLARFVRDRGRQVGLVDVHPAGCISAGRAGERLAHIDELWQAGVRLFTDDGDAVMDTSLARRAMEYIAELGGVFAEHAEDASLVRAGHIHEGEVSSRLGILGRPAVAEEIVVARDLALVRLTGCRYHVLHATTAGTVDLIDAAKQAGLPVTAEATPHHLALDHHAAETTDPAFKVNPPLRSLDDVEALRGGVLAGVIDAVATDHAPHASQEKDVPFEEAPSGVIGLETAAAVVRDALAPDQTTFFDRLSAAPARIAGLREHGGRVEAGRPANVCVFDPGETWTFDSPVSKAVNSPFLGNRLVGRSRFTVFEGRVTFREGKVEA